MGIWIRKFGVQKRRLFGDKYLGVGRTLIIFKAIRAHHGGEKRPRTEP